MRFTVYLKSRGNPDLGQDPDRELPGVPDRTYVCRSIASAALACREWIAYHQLGGGNLSEHYQ